MHSQSTLKKYFPKYFNTYSSHHKTRQRLLLSSFLASALTTSSSSPTPIGYKLFTWGECRKTSLGLGDIDRDTSHPLKIPSIDSSGYLSISNSLNSTGIITGNGEIFMFGYSDYNQLGQPTDQPFPSTSTSIFSSLLSGGKSKIQMIKTPTKIKVPSATNFIQIACGNRHSAAIDDEGHLYTWGWNGTFLTSNALGHGKRNRTENNSIPKRIESLLDHKIVQVSCGDKHTLCLTSDGEIYAFGYGEHGRLGTGHTSSYSTPVKLSYFNDIQMSFICAAKEFSFAVSSDSDVSMEFDADNDYSVPYGWGRNDRNQMGIGGGLAMDMYSCDPTPQPINLKNIVDLGLSDGDVIAVDVDGEVYQWGDRLYLSPQNINLERGIDEEVVGEGGKERIVKVDITSSMMCFVTNYGNVYTCSKTFGMKSDICSLGQGSVEPYKIVKKVEALDGEFVCDVVCADGRCLAVCK